MWTLTSLSDKSTHTRSIPSVLTCHFVLSLRQFEAFSAHRGTHHTASTVLDFAAQTSGNLPPFIASFAHPIHVDSALSDMDPDAIIEDSDGLRG